MNIEILKQKGNHFLWIDNELWMWDIPIEKKVQKGIASSAFGDVLVGGYGLGVVQLYLVKNQNVTSVTTVEIHEEIISECRKVLGRTRGRIVIMDFFDMEEVPQYNCVIGDLWADILPESLDAYIKFKEKALTLLRPGGKILAWGQDYFEYLIEKRD